MNTIFKDRLLSDPWLLAEIGVNHDGQFNRAVEMIESSANAGFDGVKFQYWIEDELLAKDVPMAPYQGSGDQRDLLRPLALSIGELEKLQGVAKSFNLDFVVTPSGERACHEIASIGVSAIKIGSGDADNPWLIGQALDTGLPLIVATGMMTDDELRDLSKQVSSCSDIVLLHCVTSYPAELETIDLRRMTRIKEISQIPVGYSDHSIGIAAPSAAIALGACMVEKHVTWSVEALGPDHRASLSLDNACSWVNDLKLLAKGIYDPVDSDGEKLNKPLVRKGLYLTRDMSINETIGKDDIIPLRPVLDGIGAGKRDFVVGKKVSDNLSSGHLLKLKDLLN
ncbi:MAG: hypothetical protein HKL80_10765 [Acidimicrobiales bacterium]|nr:hypothetical protein [Acidimicrobiales bacterium]